MDKELSILKPNQNLSKGFLDLYNKANRLVAAVFMVLKIIEETDIVKSKIKDLSIDLLSLVADLLDVEDGGGPKNFVFLEKNILELISLLEVASISGLISEMNSSILKSEFNLFLSSIQIFDQQIQKNKNNSIRNILPEDLVREDSFVSQKLVKDTELVKDINKGHKRKDVRKTAILEFIKEHKNVSIKDIVPNIRGCSEKTIQRELTSLLSGGQIKKTGERRWSRYYVV